MLCVGDGGGGGVVCVAAGSGTTPEPRRATPLHTYCFYSSLCALADEGDPPHHTVTCRAHLPAGRSTATTCEWLLIVFHNMLLSWPASGIHWKSLI